MRIRVLGAAAGGGFPQWNCNCANCHGVRSGTLNTRARTQSSIAVSVDGERWILFNASPDIRAQLEHFPEIHPRGVRGTGIEAIVLVDSQIDHTTGLLMLREGCPLKVYATDMVQQDLSTGFPIFKMLDSWDGGIDYHQLAIDGSSFEVEGIDGLRLTAVALTGKAPPYSPHRRNPHPGDNIGLLIEDTLGGSSVFYAPGLGDVDDRLTTIMQRCDCVMVDGTFWQEDEMALAGVGTRLASEMGHLPQSGRGGMIEKLRALPEQRKILIHINNTNPILIEDSKQREQLNDEGIEVAFDGMEVDLGRPVLVTTDSV
ncbi:coenzyme PQQ biosynthesis protein B [Luminiphilus syltensis NOR5-1B]|uniref:Coenzyme PQQ synthesis protein B n=1 Tax=Luminiphilus syltensis NOR5-1B TaxID=565045 RepID=B8KVB6_9GAMM|nr:pyrroloquinoline quinone biosynthesis protein PqqB [Luminiphilus syltensis]EED34399.1 coenzyme PQQ biosynthesis protein B [Luminiphilus syltensis NOR5-1B]